MMLSTIDDHAENKITTKSTEQQLIQFMTDWGNLSGRRDTETLAGMLPDDLVLTMADGAVLTKMQYLEGIKAIPADFTITDFDQHAVVHNETAIVTARYIFAVDQTRVPMRYTATFIKREGSWQPVAFHSSPVAVS